MLLTKNVTVKWNNSNREHYESLGYSGYHRGKEFEIDVMELSPGSAKIVLAKCDYCGITYQPRFYKILYNRNNNIKDCCPKCTGKKTSDASRQKRVDKYYYPIIEICQQEGYIPLSTIDEIKTKKDKFRYICPKHGETEQSIDNILKGCRCNACGNEKIKNNLRFTPDKVEQIVNSINGNILLNKEEYIGAFEHNLKIKCSCGRTYITSLGVYNQGKQLRCPSCAQSESYGEVFIREYLDELGIEYEQEKKFSDCRNIKPLMFDFYLPKYNLIIEFDGQFHFATEKDKNILGTKRYKSALKTQINDKIKNEYCKSHNIHLLRIPYWEKENIKTIIDNKIKELENID